MIELNQNNFNKEIINSDKLSLIGFWRPGCSSCLNLFPLMSELSKDFKDKINIGVVNIYENQEIAKKYKIPAVPTLIIFINGEAKEKAVGLRSKEILVNKINSLL
jgi:thioredoxin 1